MTGGNTDLPRLLVLDLPKLVQWNEQGLHSRLLADSGATRLVLMTLRAGKEIKEHRSPSQLIVQVVDGCIVLTAAETSITLCTGMVCQLAAGLPHQVHAEKDTVFLLTMAPSPTRRQEGEVTS